MKTDPPQTSSNFVLEDINIFLAALSSSRSLVAGSSVRPSVCPSVRPLVRPLVGHQCEKVREAIKKKSRLVMEFFRKGGGVTQSLTFEAHFCASRVKVFFV